jgi:hypothetical protein
MARCKHIRGTLDRPVASNCALPGNSPIRATSFEVVNVAGDSAVVRELTRLPVDLDLRDDLLASSSAMIADFEADRAGFLGAQLVELPGGERTSESVSGLHLCMLAS